MVNTENNISKKKISYYKKCYCTCCGEKIDATRPTCPKCKAANVLFQRKYLHDLHIGSIGNITLFLVGFLGLNLIGSIISVIVGSIYAATHTTAEYNAFAKSAASSILINGLDYLTLIIALFLLLIFAFKGIKEYGASFKGKTVLWGLLGFAILYGASIAWSLISTLIQNAIVASTGLNFEMTVNANQSTINKILDSFPVLSFIVFGVMGPVCEELTYRAGLFSFLKRKNRVFAYILVAIIFGCIHFDFECFIQGSATYNDYMANMINELLNLPDYMIAGVIFSLIYDRHGIGASTFSHVFYNIVALVINIVAKKMGI